MTDFSCKRTEFFNTFNTICNIKELLECVDKNKIKNILLVSASDELKLAVKSIFTSSTIDSICETKKNFSLTKGLITNHIFFFKALTISIFNLFSNKNERRKYKN